MTEMVVERGLLQALNAKLLGSGPKVVVLAHGFGSDQSVWQQILPSVLKEFRVLLFDLRCAGSTDPEKFELSSYADLSAYADDLLEILDELQVKRCMYVGHSVAGMIGCIAAIKRAYQFEKLVLLSASPRYLNGVDYYGGFDQEDVDRLYEAMSSNFKAWVTVFAPLVVGPDMKGSVQEFSRTLLKMRPDIALIVAKAIFQSDFRAILPEVKVPCHILQSTKDHAVPVVVSDYMNRNLGGQSVVAILPTEGHLVPLTAPEILVPALECTLKLEQMQ